MPTNKKKDKKKVRRQRKPRVKKEEKAFTIREPIKPGIGGNVGTSLVHQLDNKLAEFNKNQFIRQFTPVGLPAAFGGFPAPEKKEENKKEFKKEISDNDLERMARRILRHDPNLPFVDFAAELTDITEDKSYHKLAVDRMARLYRKINEETETPEEAAARKRAEKIMKRFRETGEMRAPEDEEEEERGRETAIQTVIEPPAHQDFAGQTIIQPPEHPRFHGHVVNETPIERAQRRINVLQGHFKE